MSEIESVINDLKIMVNPTDEEMQCLPEISGFEAEIILKEIERLKELLEDEKLNKEIAQGHKKEVQDIELQERKEIERLNNIINKLEKSLKWQRKVSLSLNEAFAVSRIDTLINKLQELKGSDKE